MIQIQHISIKKGRKTIIKDVSFGIQPGKVSVVIGQNGAGKSTLLETLTGSNKLSSGDIQWDGQAFDSFDTQLFAQRRAVLSQHIHVAFPIKVFELIEMGAYPLKERFTKRELKQLIELALEEVKMLEFSDRDFNTLSGGEQKRVLLAKCMIQLNCVNVNQDIANSLFQDQEITPNKYLFLDEPTASLDIQYQYKLLKLIKQLAKKWHIGVFAVLHDINLAVQLADEILVLKAGRLVAKGAPYDVINPSVLEDALGIHAIIQPHPVLGCPHITTLPLEMKELSQQTIINHLRRS